jgi:hypothetical protein
MPSTSLSTIAGNGSSVFVTKQLGTNLQVASGSSGTLISIPQPPAGQRVKFEFLFAAGVGAQQSGITVNSGATVLISGGQLDDTEGTQGNNRFSIGARAGATADRGPVFSELDETFTVVKDSGSTTADIYYSYSYGI